MQFEDLLNHGHGCSSHLISGDHVRVSSGAIAMGDDSSTQAVSLKAVNRVLSMSLHDGDNSHDDIGDNHSA
jgi:hypothetical protein